MSTHECVCVHAQYTHCSVPKFRALQQVNEKLMAFAERKKIFHFPCHLSMNTLSLCGFAVQLIAVLLREKNGY